MKKERSPKIEKHHNTLQAKVIRYVLVGSFVLGLVTLAIGLTMYTYSLVEQLVSESYGIACTAVSMIERTIDVEKICNEVFWTYRGLSEEEMNSCGSLQYRRKFEYIRDEQNYYKLQDLLYNLKSNSNIYDIYVGIIDRRTKALIYVCDPDTSAETGCFTGEWEPLEDRELNTFLNSDGAGKAYDIGMTERYGYMCTTGTRLRDDLTEDAQYFVLVDVTTKELTAGITNFILRFGAALILVVILLGWRMSRRMDKALVQPINSIASAARGYVDDRRKGLNAMDHFSKLNINACDEVENLCEVMADMESGLTEYENNLTRITAERERITTELDLAERIQLDMLPDNFDDYSSRNEFDIYAVMDPAREVGGDFYDFYMLDDDHLVLTIADVSGKGIPAALFMMASKIKLEDYTYMGKRLCEVLEKTNDDIISANVEQMFVTVWMAVLEISTGKVTAVNAGHEYPALKKKDGKFEIFRDTHSFVVGGMEGIKYREYEFTLEPGSSLFVYTDGVPEAASVEKELFGTGRMLEALNRNPDAGVRELLKNVHDAVDDFAGEEPQYDDLTMLAIQYFGPGHQV